MDDIYAEDFQAHLERIPEYLIEGEWWHYDNETNEVVFHDGDGELDNRACGPELKWFSNFGIGTLQK